MKKRTKGLIGVIAFVSISGLSAGYTSAYLSRPLNQLNNVITAGSVNIKLSETAWDREKARNLTAGAVIPKNPIITNTGKNDAWVFLKVSIPVRNIRTVDAKTHKKTAAENRELFQFISNSKWISLESAMKGSDMEYIYGYSDVLHPGQNTEELFSQVQLIPYLEGQLDANETFEIPVKAIAIQEQVENEESGLQEIYKEYLKQEE